MLFNSYEFIIIFLPVIFVIYLILVKNDYVTLSRYWIVLSSIFFYGWWNILYVPIIVGSLIFNYLVSRYLYNGTISSYNIDKKKLLVFGIATNLLLLIFYKYVDFIAGNLAYIAGIEYEPLNLLLPLAISFFTFQQIAYLVDTYKGDGGNDGFLSYCVFVTFFPQLIAGPIVHHKEMMPQFRGDNIAINYRNIAAGIFIFSIGLFKKVVIADTFAVWAVNGFDVAETLNFLEAWTTSLSYTMQLYFDFSGYSDMAIGLALMFNIVLPVNFNSPYKALNIQDFWRRWHITLSRFLRDYVYIPLGGNKAGYFRTQTNVIVTFLLGGLWHGAGWTFVFWGLLHGIALVIFRIWQRLNIRIWSPFAWFLTFMFVNFAWVFFRANEWSDAIKVLRGMVSINNIVLPQRLEISLYSISEKFNFGVWGGAIQANNWTLLWLMTGLVIVLCFDNSIERGQKFLPTKMAYIYSAVIFSISFMSLDRANEFLYFNF